MAKYIQLEDKIFLEMFVQMALKKNYIEYIRLVDKAGRVLAEGGPNRGHGPHLNQKIGPGNDAKTRDGLYWQQKVNFKNNGMVVQEMNEASGLLHQRGGQGNWPGTFRGLPHHQRNGRADQKRQS